MPGIGALPNTNIQPGTALTPTIFGQPGGSLTYLQPISPWTNVENQGQNVPDSGAFPDGGSNPEAQEILGYAKVVKQRLQDTQNLLEFMEKISTISS